MQFSNSVNTCSPRKLRVQGHQKTISVRNAIQQFYALRGLSPSMLSKETQISIFFFVFCVYKKVRFYKSRSQCPTITIIIMNMTKIEANHTRSFLKQKSMTSFELRLLLVFSIINQLENL